VNAVFNLLVKILPFILRRNKASILSDLPPKVIIDMPCLLTKEQRGLYADFQKGLRLSDDSLETELQSLAVPHSSAKVSSDHKMHPLKAMLHLSLLCVDPALVSADGDGLVTPCGKLARLTKLLVESGVVTLQGNSLQYMY
jgi:SNF2 family DNA or RNA helicase